MDTANIVASGICGVILPFVISFLKSASWPRYYKVGLALGTSLIVAVVIALVTGDVDLTILANWGVIFGTAETLYTTILSKSGLEDVMRSKGVK